METRRDFVKTALAGAGAWGLGGLSRPAWGGPSAQALPTADQLLWHEQELGMFFHYDLPVFKPGWNWRSWRNNPTPDMYNPDQLDTDQWMEAAKAMGAKYVVFVAKHCSGFLQWQSNVYAYGLKESKWRGGKGDVVRDFVNSARRAGLKPGLYASVSANGFLGVDNPGRVNRGRGGDDAAQRRYNKICEDMCTELWRNYGDLFEIWFDGGALAPEKGGPDLVPILHKYQPHAILFQGPENAGNIIRWIGNERGVAPYPCWGAARAGTQSGGDREEINHGNPDGRIWAPGECDVPLYPGKWMWGDRGVWRPWSDDQLIDMYYRSVGRNCNLLLNATPNDHGLVPEKDIARYKWFSNMIKTRTSNALGAAKGEGDVVEIRFKTPTVVNQVIVQEDITTGHRIRQYEVEGELAAGGVKALCTGSCVGHKRIQMFEPTAVKALRFKTTKAREKPLVRNFQAFNCSGRIVAS